MSHRVFRLSFPSPSLALLSSALLGVGLAGCFAGTAAKPDAGTGSGGTGILSGVGGSGGSGTGAGGAAGTRPPCDGSASCLLPIPEGCGDGINNQGGIEACDDGNTLAGDGCNGACQVEPNWTCPPAGACMRKFACGDGIINPGEVCDDGNTTDGDGCDATCTVQDGRYTCMPGQVHPDLGLRQQARRTGRDLRRRQRDGGRRLQLDLRRRAAATSARPPDRRA